ncbi:MAG TPA: DUF6583 family protein [Pseudogracilibacillus sp.]|nr:DUF6583 family protein [Pseudogracilibacillus sp.]
MEETASTQKQNKMKKWLIIGLIVALVGAGIYIFALKKSPKAQYFLAELASMEQMTDFFDNRFKLEKSWSEYQQHNPIGMQLDVSGNYRDHGLYYFLEVEEILNNTELSLEAEWDHKNKLASMTAMPNIMGAKLDAATFAINENELMIELPFIKDVLALKDEDINEYIRMFNNGYSDGPQVDFTSIFDKASQDDLMAKVLENYGQFVFDYLSDDSFTAVDERINVNGQNMKTKRITLQLDEREVQEFLKELLYEMRSDDESLDMLANVFAYTSGENQEVIKSDIKEALADIQKELKHVSFKNGLTSTVWIHNKTVVQRELELGIQDEYTDSIIVIDGEQTVNKEGLDFDYELTLIDNMHDAEAGIELEGAFSRDARDADDYVTLYFDLGYDESLAFFYEASEQLDGKEKNFDRQIGLRADDEEAYVDWSGYYAFDEGRFLSDNTFSLDGPSMDIPDAALQINVEAEKIRGVTLPDKNKVKNIGNMSAEELDDYLYEVIEPGLESWFMGSFLDMSEF